RVPYTTLFRSKLMPAIEDGSASLEELREKAQESGFVMSEDSVKDSAKFGDALDDLQQSVMGIIHRIGGDLLPVFTDQLIPAIQDNVVPMIEKLGEKIGDLVEWFVDLSPSTQKTIVAVTGLVAAIGPLLGVVGMMIKGFSTVIPIIKAVGVVIGFLTSRSEEHTSELQSRFD